ncbi:MAG: hypothetical protein O2956_13000 [Gemmatimonadetes bacterium]|nr:hypothetical protein [Gemmatimonadota bacterium]
MTVKSVRFVTVLGLIAVSACGGDDLVNVGELSEAEVAELTGAVMWAALSSGLDLSAFQPAAAAGGPQATPISFNRTVAATVPCPLGGNVGVAGSLTVTGDTEAEGGRLAYEVTHVHDGCVVASETDRQFTFWGNPDLGLEFFVDVSEAGGVEWGGDIEGAVDWETGGREGTCVLNVTFSGAIQLQSEAGSATVSGTACGTQISQSLSIG